MQTKPTPAEGKDSAKLEAESALRGVACSEIIKFVDESPPNDYNFDCVIVFKDGHEAKSDGGTVHDCCVKSSLAYGWRRYIPNA